jgi:hypothetical protein
VEADLASAALSALAIGAGLHSKGSEIAYVLDAPPLRRHKRRSRPQIVAKCASRLATDQQPAIVAEGNMKIRKLIFAWAIVLVLAIVGVLSLIYPNSWWALLVALLSIGICFVPFPKAK